MKKYFEVVLNVTLVLAGIFGTINWIENLSTTLEVNNAFMFIVGLILAPFFIFIGSIIPFLGLAIWIFPIAFILYGIYWLINKLINN